MFCHRTVTIACLAFSLWPAASPVRAENDGATEEPRLIVLIVVDQLRGDLVTRFAADFADDGFQRLMKGGALFANAHYSYGATETAPGHATIATGRLPRRHGIVANKWYPDPAKPSGLHAVTDAGCCCVPAPADAAAPGASPRSLIGPALGDQLKVGDRRSRVFAVALKDRAAILTGGQRPDGAIWWDLNTGCFVTSSWYADKLPDYVESWNAAAPADQYAGKPWNLLLDASRYEGCRPVEPSWHGYLGLGHEFPHVVPKRDASRPRDYYAALWCTPFGNDLVIDMAERVLRAEKLGAGPAIDMLSIGLSSNDLVGHYFGPDSIETRDMTLQTDRQLARLLRLLDETVGLSRCLIALTGDHGVTTTPLVTERLRLGGGILDLPKVQAKLNDQLQSFFPPPDHGEPPHTIVYGMDIPWVYLNRSLLGMLSPEKRQALMRRAVEVMRGFEGVDEVFPADELTGPMPSPADTHRYLAWRCFHPQRSGELYVRLGPYWYKTDDKIAGHDSGSNHDRHVPIFLLGPRVKPGRYYTPADPCDIAPTLAALAGIEAPLDADGRVLHEAIDSRP